MRTYFLIFFGIILLFSTFLYFRSGNISDADSFYHFRHADIYRENGILTAEFPWTQYSVINKFSSDIWYGFHLILTPFTVAGNPVFGMKLAGTAITILATFLFYWSIARLNVSQKFFWPFLLLFSSPYILYRLAMLRPHVISVGLSALFFSFLINGGFWSVFLTSFAFVFLHISLFWVPILIFGIFALVRLSTGKFLEWRKALALISGLFAGWILRPNPLGAARIAYDQIVQLLIEKQRGIPLHFGMELLPLPIKNLGIFIPFIILWLAALLIFLLAVFRQRKRGGAQISSKESAALFASAILSVAFFLMTMLVAQRSFDFLAVFGAIFVAFVFSCFLSSNAVYKNFSFSALSRKVIIGGGICIFAFMAIYGIYKQGKFLDEFGWEPYRFKPAAEWIKNNSKEGEVVFNTSWDYFPELFFWNTENYYASGMDPVFQYVYDPKLYWKSYYFELGKAAKYTCASTYCGPSEVEDSYEVLKRDFKASYVFLSKLQDKNFYDYLLTDPRFSSRYEDENVAVFQLEY